MARTCRRSAGSSSHRGTRLFRTPGPLGLMPLPVMMSTQRRPASREAATNAASARCASAWVIPWRSRRASIVCRPRFSRSALARSIPAKRSSGAGVRGGLGRCASVVAAPGSGTGIGAAAIDALRPRNGCTSRTACCQNARSLRGPATLLVLFTSRRLVVLDENDMETPGPVCTEFDVLLDICSARRPGDEIDHPR